MTFTVLGSTGFIGSRLASRLRAAGEEVATPARDDDAYLGRELGHVIYCVGVTSDFRTRPLDTIDAHVTRLMPLLRRGRFESLLYLSSTRVYRGTATAHEEDPIILRPDTVDDLYNASKAMGEFACLASGRLAARVVRLSNVHGPGMSHANFLAAVAHEAIEIGRVTFRTTPDSCKDYVALDDVVGLLPRIAAGGRHRIYNVAFGVNVTNADLGAHLARLTGASIATAADAAISVYPPISIERAAREFGFAPAPLADRLPDLIRIWRERTVAA